MKNKAKNKIPKFKNEDEERDFWAENSPLDFFDMSKAEFWELPNLKPSTESISIRMPSGLLDTLKIEANKRDVPYQSLIKIILTDWTLKQPGLYR